MFLKKININQIFLPYKFQIILRKIFPKIKGYWLPLSWIFMLVPSKLKAKISFQNIHIEIPLDLSDPYQLDIFCKNKYELMEPFVISKLLPKYGSFFDVGANCGWYTRIVSKLNNEVKIFAFEPNMKAFSYLKEFCSEKILTLPIAVADNSVDKVKSIKPFYRQSSSTYFKKSSKGINSISLDLFSEKNNIVPDLIKIDVEGFELKVLRGADKLLDICNYLLIEVNNSNSVKGCDYDPKILFDILRKKKFYFKYDISNKNNMIKEINTTTTGTILFSKEDIKSFF